MNPQSFAPAAASAPSGALHKIRLAFAVAALAMLMLAAGTYLAIDRLLSFGHFAVHSDDRLLYLEQVERTLGASAVSLRDYLLTGNPADRDRLEERIADYEYAFSELRSNGPVPDQPALDDLVRRHSAWQREAASRRATGDMETALAVLHSGGAQDAARGIGRVLVGARAAAQKNWIHAHTPPTAEWTRALMAATALVLLAILGWVLYVLRHHERERRAEQRRLADSEAMGRTLAANMAEGLLIATADLRVAEVNDAALQLLGASREDLVGRPVGSLLLGEVAGVDLSAWFARALARAGSFREADLQALGLHRSGRLVPLRIAFNDLHVQGERRIALLLHDMTAIQRATDALHASESQLRQIADALPVMVAQTDRTGRLSFHNRALAAFLQVAPAALDGAALVEVLGADRYAAFWPHLEQAFAGEEAQFEWTETGGADGPRHYQVNLLPRRASDGDVTGCLVQCIDVTPLKRIDRMKTEFVSIVSHELRTPLTSIRGSLGLIAGGAAGVLPKPVGELVAIARNNCDRLVRLINDILDIEKIESGKLVLRLQRQDVTEVVRQALAANEGFAREHRVALDVEAPPQPLLAEIDSDRLIQVVTNLVSNAVKFSPAGAQVSVRVLSSGPLVRVEVQDRGPGIPEAFRDRIFQKFSQADASDTRSKGGTGLGLSIARQLVERMGGQIGYESAPTVGTLFHFELPACTPAAATDGAPAAAQAARSLPRVLVCDSGLAATEVQGRLQAAGFAAEAAGSVQQASERLARGGIDVLALDAAWLAAQPEDLLAQLHALQRDGRGLPVVVVADGGDVDRLRGQVSLAFALWLQRPLDEERLVAALREAVGQAEAEAPQVLHVEDDPDLQRIVATLARSSASCVSVPSLRAAREQLAQRRFDLVLLDLALADGCGWELLPALELQQPRPPVIVFSASEAAAPQGAQVDAMLVKSQTSEAALLQAIRRALPSPAG